MGAIRRLNSLVRVPAAFAVALLAITMALLTPSVASAQAEYPPTTAAGAAGGVSLPATGSDVDGIVIGATGLLAAGALTVLATRRRHHSHAN